MKWSRLVTTWELWDVMGIMGLTATRCPSGPSSPYPPIRGTNNTKRHRGAALQRACLSVRSANPSSFAKAMEDEPGFAEGLSAGQQLTTNSDLSFSYFS